MEQKIAVIGIAGRFPDADNIYTFSKNLEAGKYSIRDISPERMRQTTIPENRLYQKRGYMDNIHFFDYKFFNIPLGEAIHMDPHQRQLLEVVYETIENAGYNADVLYGSNTAVYVADKNLQYYEHADVFDPTLVTGNASEFMATRISRAFNFTGAVALIDTSCSSSLVAMHNACNELLLGNADQAIVCGANLELFPYKDAGYHIEVDSPDGLSIPFSNQSNGMVYGEAVIAVLLKPLDRALADKDFVHAIIAASAVNNNAARSASLTAPDSIGQADVIKKAWKKAGIDPMDLGFIEAHGSGTLLGDSLEIAGLNLAFQSCTDKKSVCPVSTVKANIGHSRSVAGLAGLIKAIASMQRRVIFPAVYTGIPSPQINFDKAAVYINEKPDNWRVGKNKKRYAGVSSIGFSGTNCHIILEEANTPENVVENNMISNQRLFVFSSWTKENLFAHISSMLAYIQEHTAIAPDDISYTLNTGRKHYNFRKAFVAEDRMALITQLEQYLQQPVHIRETVQPVKKMIFVFSDGKSIKPSFVEIFKKTHPGFTRFYNQYYEQVPVSVSATHELLSSFLFQLSFYQYLESLGVCSPNLVGTGMGRIIVRVINNSVSFTDAIEAVLAYQTEQYEGLEQRVQQLLDREVATEKAVILEIGGYSMLSPVLKQHAWHNQQFYLFTITAFAATEMMEALGAFLFEQLFELSPLFFNEQQGLRVPLPARPFVKTPCWIRDQARVWDGEKILAEAGMAVSTEKRSPLENYLADCWKKELGAEEINKGDHFFEMGGDSLMATRMINRIRKNLYVKIDFEDIFDYPVFEDFYTFLYKNISIDTQLVLIWKEVLKSDDLTATDNFFEIGGHSLLANQILNRVKEGLGVQLNFEDFFLHPTIQEMGKLIVGKKSFPVETSAATFIPLVEAAESYPLSHGQRRLWIINEKQQDSVAYNECNVMRLKGTVDVNALQQSFRTIIERHESFRTCFPVFADGPRQVINPYTTQYDLEIRTIPAGAETEKMVQDIVYEFAGMPFTLSTGPLIKSLLLCIAPDNYVLLVNIHHIVFDEWSFQVFQKEVITLYNAFSKKQSPVLPALRIQYKDYASWMNQQLDNDPDKKMEHYWLNQLKDAAAFPELPTDFPRPPVKTYNGRLLSVPVPADVKHIIEKLSRQQGTSLFMTLLAVLKLMIYKYTGQQEIVMGTAIAGRENIDLEDQIGFYVNTLALKTVVDPAQPFSTLLSAVKQTVIDAYQHQLYPFDLLIEKLDLKTDQSRLPLVDVFVLYRKENSGIIEASAMNGIAISAFGRKQEQSKFDLSFEFIEHEQNLFLGLIYSTDLYSSAYMEQLVEHYFQLCRGIDVATDKVVDLITYISDEEQKLLKQFGESSELLPAGNHLYQLFAKQVALNADCIALRSLDVTITYAALEQKADQLAAYLMTQYQLKKETPVALFMQRSPEMVIAMLAVFKTGAAYMPLSIYEPAERIRYQLQTAGVQYLITHTTLQQLLNKDILAGIKVIDVHVTNTVATSAIQYPERSGDDLACILYTSGSTDKPKAVKVPHRGLANIVQLQKNQLSLQPSDIILQQFNYIFDFSVYEIFGALCNGCSLYLPDESQTDYTVMIDLLEKEKITGLCFTPTAIKSLLAKLSLAKKRLPDSVRWVVTGGEALKPAIAQQYHSLSNAPLYNIYGPTETSVYITYCEVRPQDHRIHVGKPIAGNKVYILDHNMRAVGIGVKGILYVSGINVTKGYITTGNNTSSTAFIPDPFSTDGQGLLYCTGDNCRWLPDGNIEFLERSDNQIKHKGFRIDVGEIESTLICNPAVEQAVVVKKTNSSGADLLAAYIVTNNGSIDTKPDSNQFVENDLVPTAISADDLALLHVFNDTARAYPLSTMIWQYLERWAVKAPDKTAVRCGTESITYAQLNNQANVLANTLISRGIKNETIVPVLCSRSIDLLVAILGIFKAGAVYMPLSPDAPADRSISLLQDCAASWLVLGPVTTGKTVKPDLERIAAGIEQVIELTDLLLTDYSVSEKLYENPDIQVSPDALAYIIYTSGSTGKPKGAMIEHLGMLNHLHNKVELLQLKASDTIVQNAPQIFDISIWQFLVMLIAGGTTIIYTDEVVHAISDFSDELLKDQPTILELVPSYLDELLNIIENKNISWSPTCVMVTGETLKPALTKRWFHSFPHIPLVNAYGPTEAADDITHFFLHAYDAAVTNIPIGKTIRNMKIYVLDTMMNHCPIGSKGEIYVSGAGVGRGYLNDPEKTAAVFLQDPWKPGTRMYKTGDIGRYTVSGDLEFFGRKDQQVKIRGYRIEMGEIERALCGLAAIKDAAVITVSTASDELTLAAYCIAAPEYVWNPVTIREALQSMLPHYMVPVYLICLPQFPLTANGKIDLKALPYPDQDKKNNDLAIAIKAGLAKTLPEYMIPELIVFIDAIPLTPTGKTDRQQLTALKQDDTAVTLFTEPTTVTEKVLVGIWEEILDRKQIGIKDNFLEVGGNSLKGMRLVTEIERLLQVRLDFWDIFVYITICDQALMIDQRKQTTSINMTVEALQVIAHCEDRIWYPVSYAQRRMWLLHQLNDIGNAYSIPGALELNGLLDISAWEAAWNALIVRHEILRTSFAMIDGELSQRVLSIEKDLWNIQHFDISNMDHEWKQAVHEIAETQQALKFDLADGPLIRASLVRITNNRFVFLYTVHHILTDEWSFGIVGREIIELYEAFSTGYKPALEPLGIQYRDYAIWQQQSMLEEKWQGDYAYWRTILQGELPVLQLPYDFPRPAVKTYNGTSEKLLAKNLVKKIKSTAVHSGTTVFVNLLAGLATLLHRYTQAEDIIIGCPVAGRDQQGLDNQVGLYQNTIALRTNPQPDTSFEQTLQEIKKSTLEAFAHQSYPFDKIVEELNVRRDMGRSPVFDVMMVMHDAAINLPDYALGNGLAIGNYDQQATGSKFDLSFHFLESGDDLLLSINYNTDLFTQPHIQMMLRHYEVLLNNLLAAPAQPIATISYIDEAERNNLLSGYQGKGALSAEISIDQWFEKTALAFPNEIAVQCNDETITYRQLSERSNQCAHFLSRSYGIGKTSTVAICMERSISMIIAMLGIVKTGASYLPVERSFPQSRIQYILDNSQAQLLITNFDMDNALTVLIWDKTLEQALQAEPAQQLLNGLVTDDIVYTIYTSGSTGMPKGVAITHKGLVNYAAGFINEHHLTQQDKGLLVSSVAFDLGYTCLWPTLLIGAQLHLLPENDFWNPREVLQIIHSALISFIKLTPSHFKLLVQEITDAYPPACLRMIVLGGEKIRPEDLRRWMLLQKQTRFINHYGPTETTIGVLTQGIVWNNNTGTDLDLDTFSEQVVLGRPLGHHHVYVLDPAGMLCGTAVPGELYIGGPGLAAGYINHPDLTAEKFVVNPFDYRSKLYRTGDKGRWLPDGRIQFLGRLDEQVQVRGYRVEPGEIEQELRRHPAIQQAAVLAIENNEQVLLTAYIVSKDYPGEKELNTFLSKRLPHYMIPRSIFLMDTLPLTANGKIDYKKLPLTNKAPDIEKDIREPVSTEEKLLTEVLTYVLGLQEISIKDDFFKLGGDSIIAIQMVSQLYRKGYKLDVRDIFTYPVMEDLAIRMQPVSRKADQSIVTGEIPLSPIQADFFNRDLLHPYHYNQSLLLYFEERIQVELLQQVVEKLLLHHDALRISFRINPQDIIQVNNAATASISIVQFDLRNAPDAYQAMTAEMQLLQRSFRLQEGPLFKAAVFQLPDADRLLLLAHHLVVDGISWRIILEDLAVLYKQASMGEALLLPEKTDSFKFWVEQMYQYANSEKFKTAEAYWLRQAMLPILPLPKSLQSNNSNISGIAHVGFLLEKNVTQKLLREVHHAFGTEINDLLLAALSLACKKVFNIDHTWIMLEGHGREQILEHMDITRTVGWFTSAYPVLLTTTAKGDSADMIKHTKELLRSIPNKGIDYGLMNYTMQQSNSNQHKKSRPEIIFNYLGQFDRDIQNNELMIAKEFPGDTQSPDEQPVYPIAISGMVIKDQLSMTLDYNARLFDLAIMERLNGDFQDALHTLIYYCLEMKTQELTPSDLGYSDLSFDELNNIFN